VSSLVGGNTVPDLEQPWLNVVRIWTRMSSAYAKEWDMYIYVHEG
jgi:hypothetical protein